MIVRKSLVRSIPIFSGLNDEELDLIALASRQVEYPKQNIVFYEGDPGNFLCIVLSGKVRIVLMGESGKQVLLTTICKGQYFGVLSLLDEDPRSATAITLEKTVIFQLNREAFRELIHRHPEVGMKVLLQVGHWLRGADEKIRQLGLYDVYGRVVSTLLHLAHCEGRRIEENNIVIHPKLSCQDLANRVGASRETVSRALKVLKQNGYLTETRSDWVVERPALRLFSATA